MANEIRFTAQLTAAKGGASLTPQSHSTSLDMAGSNFLNQTQDVTTVGGAVNWGLLTGTPKKAVLSNLGANNITLYGDAGFTQVQDILTPGDFVLRSPGAAIYAKATTATTKLGIEACEA